MVSFMVSLGFHLGFLGRVVSRGVPLRVHLGFLRVSFMVSLRFHLSFI